MHDMTTQYGRSKDKGNHPKIGWFPVSRSQYRFELLLIDRLLTSLARRMNMELFAIK